MTNDNARLIIALGMIKRVGPAKISSFVRKNGYDYDRCMRAAPKYFGITQKEFESYLEDAEADILSNNDKGSSVISLLDDGFPKSLCECSNPVVLLYYRGNIELLSSNNITVIGTRKPDREFVEKGFTLVSKLAEHGFTIVSGLALGCDTVAHEAALRFGAPTIAVLPTPCDKPYPNTNRELAEEIVRRNGLLISEYSAGTEFSKFHLTARDRIQSMLSEKLVVIQATDDGGSMIAVRRSVDDGKEVFALTGNRLGLIDLYINPESEADVIKLVRAYGQMRFAV